MAQPERGERRAGVRWVFAFGLAVGVLALAEVTSFLALWALDGLRPSVSAWREETARVRLPEEGAGERGELPTQVATRNPITLHPFLGFVQDPAVQQPAGWAPIGPQGFRERRSAPGDPASPFVVAIFGGSFADGFAGGGAATLGRALARLPQAAGREVRVVGFAIPGYKQPQQLMALILMLALSERIDLVINLDGFNDVVLPVAENLRAGTNPFYPRFWPELAHSAADPRREVLVGEISYLRKRRAKGARLCAHGILAYSATCHLVWRSLDGGLTRRIARAERERVELPAAERSFAVTGPPYAETSPEATYRDLAAFWGRCSTLMHQLCSARGIPYFHFLQPNQYVAGSKPMGAEERRIALDPQQPYRPFAEQGYPYLIEEGRRLTASGVRFFDLTSAFAEYRERVYADNCCHVNNRGTEILAEAIGARIVENLARP
jgi:hypothetical protein